MKKIILGITVVLFIFATACSIKVTVANDTPNTIYAQMTTYDTDKSDATEIAAAAEAEIKNAAGKNNSSKSFYIDWSADSSMTYSTWVTNGGGYYLGGSTAWLSAKDVKTVTITVYPSATDITGDTYSTE